MLVRSFSCRGRWLIAALLYALSGLVTLPAAVVTIINLDGPNEGFNDPAPFSPVGGNNASTLGQARINAFEHAAKLLGKFLGGNQAIVVEARMESLGGDAVTALFAVTEPITLHRDFAGAPVPGTYYVSALASALSGVDVEPGKADFRIQLNVDVDSDAVLGETRWYYGLDGNPGADVDFVTVIMHELVHGLGFLSFVDLGTGAKVFGVMDAFSRNLEHHGAVPSAYPDMTNGQRVVASISAPNLHWTAEKTVEAAGDHVPMHAPNPAESGLSVSHFSPAVFPDQLMEPYYLGARHSPGLAARVLADMGWTVVTPPRGESGLPAPAAVSLKVSGDTVRLQWSKVSGAIGYRFYFGELPGQYYADWTELGTSGDVMASSVPAGTYYAVVTAYDAAGESAFSHEVSAVIAPPAGLLPNTPGL